MKIEIELSEEDYRKVQDGRIAVADMRKAILNGTVLRDCEHCSRIYGTLGCCSTVSNKWVYSCEEGHKEYKERHNG